MTTRNVRIALLFVSGAMLAGCSGSHGGQADAFAPVTSAAQHARSGGSTHLYVADQGAGAVLRYALADGLPSTLPEETFATIPNVQFLGVDRKGTIYAAGTNRDGFTPGSGEIGFVQKYDANGTLLGSATLGLGIAAFAVDADGYMYVNDNPWGNQVKVFSPSAFGNGLAQPVALLEANGRKGSDSFVYLAAGSGDRLYAAAYEAVNVFDHPHRPAMTQDATVAAPSGAFRPVFDGAMTFDSTNHLVANLEYLDYCAGKDERCLRKYRYLVTDFDSLLRPLQTGRRDRIVMGSDCYSWGSGGRISGTVTGMADYSGYIEAACQGMTESVWVYRAGDFHDQRALESLGGLSYPTDVKVGP